MENQQQPAQTQQTPTLPAAKQIKTFSTNMSTTEKLELTSSVSTMLMAGNPILETIDSLLEDSKRNRKKFLESVREDLSEGNHLAYALSKFPKIFDNLSCSWIKAAEEGGTLDT